MISYWRLVNGLTAIIQELVMKQLEIRNGMFDGKLVSEWMKDKIMRKYALHRLITNGRCLVNREQGDTLLEELREFVLNAVMSEYKIDVLEILEAMYDNEFSNLRRETLH